METISGCVSDWATVCVFLCKNGWSGDRGGVCDGDDDVDGGDGDGDGDDDDGDDQTNGHCGDDGQLVRLAFLNHSCAR